MNASWRTHLPTGVATRSRRIAWLTASLSCVGLSAVASAQTAKPKEVEEIIVTAQKRVERLQDVPISISVLTGKELDKLTAQGMAEALNRVPGVATNVGQQGGGVQLAVRGVTANGPIGDGASPIAYYIDSVPYGLVARAMTPDLSAYDLERVEALRGPQGTLYGASALNGVIRVLSREVNLNEFEWKVRSSLSNTDGGGDNYRADTAINVPLIDGKLGARAVAGYQDLSGWIDSPSRKDINDAVLRNFRLKVKGQPSDVLTVDFAAWYSNADYGAVSIGRDDRVSYDSSNPVSNETEVYSLRIDADLPHFSISSATSYLDYANLSSLDLSLFGLPVPILIDDIDGTVLAEEVILNSNRNDAWRWSVGAFYRDAETELWENNLGGGPPLNFLQTSESYALFGQLAHRFLNDALEWTIGLRYFHDNLLSEELVTLVPGTPPARQEFEFNNTSPRVVLTWYPAEDLTVYGSYSEGFRSGDTPGLATKRTFPDFPDVKPDTLHNYEIGAKAEMLDGRIALDLAVYYMDWQDIRQTLSAPFGATFVTAAINGESASGPGVDFGLTARPVDGLQVGASVSWNDLTMDEDVRSGATAIVFNKGDRLNMSAEYIAAAFGSYEFPLGGGGLRGQVSVSANYTSERITRATSGAEFVGDSTTIGRASLSVSSSSRWTTNLFVDNFNNERGALLVVRGIPDWDQRIRPRTVGLQFEYQY